MIRMINFKVFYFATLCIGFTYGLFYQLSAQSIPTGTPILEEYLRREQLLGNMSENVSFAIRPIHPSFAFDTENGLDLDGTWTDFDISRFNGFFGKKNKGLLMAMPFTYKMQWTEAYPFGLNDGAMIPNRGLQQIFSFGAFMKFGKFSLQLKPEILLAQNKDYLGFPIEHQSSILFYYEYMNRIDMPEKFGESAYRRILPGQSSIRYNPGNFSIGVSTENLWWGPSKRNSLILSNQAQGFLHFTANTLSPFKTPIGDFESQIFSGLLHPSGFLPPHSDYSIQKNPVLIPKRINGDRYLSGIIFSYQPKWVPGLFLGYSATNNIYLEDMDRLGDYVPFFNGQKGKNNVINRVRDKRQQFSSGFFRWISTEGHFEFYGEYGTNGNSRRLADFIINAERNRGFTVGFSNLMPLKKEYQFLQISAEMTQTGQSLRESIRNLDTWYIHHHVRHGYTNKGQALGVGYGPAANVNWLEIAWIKGYNRISLQFERIVYNNDFYYFRYEGSKDWRNKYVDLVPSLIGEFRLGNLLVQGNFQYVKTLNYKWYLENNPEKYFVPGLDRNNAVIALGLVYILK